MGIHGEKSLSTVGVYVHCPFCASKCPYCDFSSVVADIIPEVRYAACLSSELSAILEKKAPYLSGRPLESIYLGGGTPSLFSPEAVASIIGHIKKNFAPLKAIEVTLEANPDSVSLARLRELKSAGVNRVSLGVQSFDDKCLSSIGRRHGAKEALSAFEAIRSASVDNVSIDLMYGLPGQTLKTWLETVKMAVELRPEHISAYCLTIEESTLFHKIYSDPAGRKGLPGEDIEIEMYAQAMAILKDAGYVHYEISNLALPGRHSVHNSRYWLGGDYIGLGSSAHSYLYYPEWGVRWSNEPSPYAYMDMVEAKGAAVVAVEELTRSEAAMEAMVLGLRMLQKGVDGNRFRQRFGVYPSEALTGMDELVERGLVRLEGNDLLLTDQGVLLSNEVFLRISP